MPTLMQKIRLAFAGWSRRREEREREFLAENRWGQELSAAPRSSAAGPPGTAALHIDLEGLTVAYLDDSGQIQHYLDITNGEVIDTRESMHGEQYRRIPSRNAQSEFEDRRAFIASLEPSATRDRLSSCIGVAEAFRRALSSDRKLERAWFNFKNDRAIAAVRLWLREIGMG